MTVTGKTVGENIEGVVNKDPEVIRPIDNPYTPTGGGNDCPRRTMTTVIHSAHYECRLNLMLQNCHSDLAYCKLVVLHILCFGFAVIYATDVARRLGYTNPQKAIRDHVDDEDKTLNDSFTVNRSPSMEQFLFLSTR